MLRTKDLFEKTCTKCGKVFRTDKERAYVCPTCQKENKRQQEKSVRSEIRERENYLKKQVQKQAPTDLPLDVIKSARIVDKYNREHGTNYTYGQFVLALKNGKIKI